MDLDANVGANLRGLPPVQRLLETNEAARLMQAFSRPETVDAVRRVLDQARDEVRVGFPPPTPDDLLARAASLITDARAPRLTRVINGTGVVLHTNLGRAPLADEALEAMHEAGQGYCNLEFDLVSGARGSRTQGVESLLRELTGAEAGLAVNNAAAAVLLALSALASGGEVIVSRGELVEIGGGFRIPDIIAQGGARLVEVGTTNKTRLADYCDAITPSTRVLLKVHQSNYRIVGFTADTGLMELSALAQARGLLLMHDLGSGRLAPTGRSSSADEPSVQDTLKAGADLVAFSGDKLMGGPQAGLIAGRRSALEPLRRHPLLRAVRLDKTTLAALEATFRLYRDPERARRRVPALRMLSQTEAELQVRAEALCALLTDIGDAQVQISHAYAGGGASPQAAVASRAVALELPGLAPDELARRMRRNRPAVVGRIADGRLLLDLLTIADDEFAIIAVAAREAART